MKEKWVEELKVGGRFYTESPYDHGFIHTVAKITDKQIVDTKGTRFWKESGRLVGADDWSGTYLQELTTERYEKCYRQMVIAKVGKFDFRQMSIEDLRTINKLIVKYVGTKS